LSRTISRSRFSSFGPELYPEASLRAIRLALESPDRAQLRPALIASLKHRSPGTRARVADKLLQRFIEFADGRVVLTPYLRLLAGLKDAAAARQLLLWRAAAVDAVVGALAREILYPCLVEGRPPRGWSKPAFRLANAVGLFDEDRAVTRDFISRHARESWGFKSETSLTRGLRMLRQVGLIEPLGRASGSKRLIAFVRPPFSLSLVAFAYCLHRDLAARGGALGSDQVQQAEFTRLFLQEPLQVNLLLEAGRRAGLLARAAARWRSTSGSEDQLVERLLALA
jgi:hypothetical protein